MVYENCVNDDERAVVDDYMGRNDDRGVLLSDAIIAFHDMRMLLEKRSALRTSRGHSLVKYDPYRGQGRIIVSLADRDGVSQADLARALGVKRQTLSTAIKKLEREGYVERRPDPADGRVLLTFLTDAGRDFKTRLDAINAFSGSMFEALSDEELAEAAVLSKKLSTHLECEIEAAEAVDSFFERER